MKTLQDTADYYLKKLRGGDFESAFHGLIDLDPAIVHPLIAAYRAEESAELRNKVLQIIAEFRTPYALPLFDEAVRDRTNDGYKLALDGLVTLASTEAVKILESVLRGEATSAAGDSEYIDWVREALGQIQAEISK